MGGRQGGRAAATHPQPDGQACVTLREHLEILRAADQRFADERDRRYSAILREREKAQLIKQVADERALDLARDIQDYRDEQANRLREQSPPSGASTSRNPITRPSSPGWDALIKPLAEFVAAQQGRLLGEEGSRTTANDLVGRVIVGLSLLVSIASVMYIIVNG